VVPSISRSGLLPASGASLSGWGQTVGDLSAHFSVSEFACKCGCGSKDVDPELIQKLERLRNLLRVPLVIDSGVRCKTYNAKVGGKPNSAHLTGEAADLRCIKSRTRFTMKRLIYAWSLFSRVGNGDTFLHVDISSTLPQEVEWNY
jgi:Peptidase M15